MKIVKKNLLIIIFVILFCDIFTSNSTFISENSSIFNFIKNFNFMKHDVRYHNIIVPAVTILFVQIILYCIIILLKKRNKYKQNKYLEYLYILRFQELIKYVYDKIEKIIKKNQLEKILEEIKVSQPLREQDAKKIFILIFYCEFLNFLNNTLIDFMKNLRSDEASLNKLNRENLLDGISQDKLKLLLEEKLDDKVLMVESAPIHYYYLVKKNTTEKEIRNKGEHFRQEHLLKDGMRSLANQTTKDAQYNPLISFLLKNNQKDFLKLYSIWLSDHHGGARDSSKIFRVSLNKKVRKYFAEQMRNQHYRSNEVIFGKNESSFFCQGFIHRLQSGTKKNLKNMINTKIQLSLKSVKNTILDDPIIDQNNFLVTDSE